MVYRLARWINREREVIPEATIKKTPSAELRPDQKDEDSLPPYEVLDAILERYVVESESVDQIIAAGFEKETVCRIARLIDLNEYKRRQAAQNWTPFGTLAFRRAPFERSPRTHSRANRSSTPEVWWLLRELLTCTSTARWQRIILTRQWTV